MLDTSKLSNKDDLIALLGLVGLIASFGAVFYLVLSDNTFFAGYVVATITWRWREWYYNPIDTFLEKHWPTNLEER